MPKEKKDESLGELTKAMMDEDGFDSTGFFEDDSDVIPFDKPEDEPEKKVEGKETTEAVATPEPEQKTDEKEPESTVVEPEKELEVDTEVDVSEPIQEQIIENESLESLEKLTPEELADKKKEFDKYNTQTAQKNADLKKKLDQRQDDLIAAEGRMKKMLDQMNEKVESSKTNPDETEYEMLNRKLGTDFDELTSPNEIILAKRQLKSEETRAQEIEEDKLAKEKYREGLIQENIRKQRIDWEVFSKEEDIPESMQEPLLAILFAKKQQIPNFTFKQAYEHYMESIPYTQSKEAFLKFAKKSKWAADLKAVFLEEAKIKRNEAGPIAPVKSGVVPEKESKLKKGFDSIADATIGAIRDLRGK